MSKFIITVTTALVAVVVLAVAIVLHNTEIQKISQQMAILMDAGSSHTGIFVYKWRPEELSASETNKKQFLNRSDTVVAALPSKMEQITKCEVHAGGIAELNVERVNDYFKHCMGKVESKLMQHSTQWKKDKDAPVNASHVNSTALRGNDKDDAKGSTEQSSIPVYLEATAGMRLLEMRNHSAVKNVYDHIKRYLRSMSNFALKNVSTIAGTKEGLYSWLTVNYLTDTLVNKHSTYGIIECGGASSQIAHEIDSMKAQSAIQEGKLEKGDYHQLTLFSRERNIRSTSYLCYGKDQFYLRVLQLLILQKLKQDASLSNQQRVKLDNPCANKGVVAVEFKESFTSSPCLRVSASMKISMNSFANKTEFYFNGTSEPEKCYDMIKEIINETSCKQTYHYCVTDYKLLDAPVDVYAISAFYHAAVAVFPGPVNEFNGSVTQELYINNTDTLCRKDSSQFDATDKFFKTQCFSCLLVRGLIEKMYHIEDWSRIVFAKKIKGDTIGWTLGSMLFKSKYIDIRYENRRQLEATWFYGITCASVVIIIASSTVLVWLLLERKEGEKNRITN